jgi:hypothetical protein
MATRIAASLACAALALAYAACSDDGTVRVGNAHDGGSAGTAAAVDAGSAHAGGSGGSAVGGFDSPVVDAGSMEPVVCGGADLRHDPHNCGACDHDCLGTECRLGTCEAEEVGDGMDEPLQIAVDGDTVYFATLNQIIAQPKDGSASSVLLEDPQFDRHSLRARAGNLYWLLNESARSDLWALYSMPESGGEQHAVFQGVDEPITALALTDTLAVFLTTCSSIWSASLDGGDPLEIAPMTCAAPTEPALAIDPEGRFAYTLGSRSSDLWQVDLESNAAEDIVPRLNGLALAATSEHVYWIGPESQCIGDGRTLDCSGGTIKRVAVEGGDQTLLVNANFLAPMGYRFIRSLIADDHALYFELGPAGSTGSLIFSLPLGSTQTLIIGATVVAGEAPLTLDDDYVYFVDQQRLMRVAK